eukprot:TRINITY_DN1776_c0_g1_i1.p1 TRINITY_DN1776_c0_g1~~TRINITY_DN1776_c0_g1_i1.p1  ORF type:complete len:130 (-),score=2.17 TRINITY_DN1776_c0_g1_i1:520-909(-)
MVMLMYSYYEHQHTSPRNLMNWLCSFSRGWQPDRTRRRRNYLHISFSGTVSLAGIRCRASDRREYLNRLVGPGFAIDLWVPCDDDFVVDVVGLDDKPHHKSIHLSDSGGGLSIAWQVGQERPTFILEPT